MVDPQIEEGIRTKILKAFIRHLQESPVLSAQIKVWQTFSGDAHDHDVIPLSQCPALRITYSGPGQYPVTFSSSKADFAVNIELILPGTNQFLVLDFWEALEQAIDQFGSLDRTMRESIRDSRLAAYGTATIGSPAINHAKYKNPPGMVGTGSVNFTLSIRR
jgi:hypothetical protein